MVTVAYLRPGLGVVGLVNAPTPYHVELELTTDFSHWRNITPPIPGSDQYGGIDVLRNVSFPTPSDGWVVAGLSTGLELYRTTDGGTSWQDEGSVTSGGSAGDELVDFLDASHGWREVIAPTAGMVSLAVTNSGGKTWNSIVNPGRWPSAGVLSFSGGSNGFLADTLPPSRDLPSEQPISAFSPLWETTDSGQRWHTATVRLPAGFSEAQSYKGLPTFTNAADGVLPVVLFQQDTISVAFFATSNGGDSWSYLSLVRLGSTADTGLSLSDELPSAAVAGLTTWWVVSAIRPNGHPMVHVTNDAGKSWSSDSPVGIPSSFATAYPIGIAPVQASSAAMAWTMVQGASGCGLYGTTDGGVTWTPVCPGGLGG